MPLPSLLLETLGASLAGMFALWLVSLWLRDASIVDIFWGPLAGLIAAVAWGLGDAHTPRSHLVVVLTLLWGLRLGLYLLWRNAGQGEDFRYRAMRERQGPTFALKSLVSVFGLQAVLMWLVSWPAQAAIHAPAPASLGALDLLGGVVFSFGLLFESVGDWQLARFKADPANRGRVMDRGLWSWTRHPNYFGDFTVWWGLFCFAAATGAWWSAVGPALMSFLLIRVSGKAMLERHLRGSKPGWKEYAERTSGFFPRPPRRAA
ncbi:MAG: DUF1295 domain-containing protein [Myxococcota bacterium]